MQDQEQKINLRVDVEPDQAVGDTARGAASDVEHRELLPCLGDSYEILSLLGTGGMSIVYKVREKSSGNVFVAKLLRAEFLSDDLAKQRFEQEAQLVQQLTHPNIINVQRYAMTDDGTPYLIMEWLDGITLADYIRQRGAVPAKEAISIFEQITRGLNYAHSEGIIHRDIKPSNVLLVASDNKYNVKIMDFGIAKILGPGANDVNQTQAGSVLGSPAYMSPEQCLGDPIDARSDIYSFGCMMYETLTGTNPFVCSTPLGTILKHLESEAEPLTSESFAHLKIPDYLDQVVSTCLSKASNLRYPTANCLRQALFMQSSGIARLTAIAVDICLLWGFITVAQFFLYPEMRDLLKVNHGLELQAICLVYILYYVAFESSFLHATPGKLVTGLRITGIDGGKPSPLGALGRALVACAAVIGLALWPETLNWSDAIDFATGSHFSLLNIIGNWGWFILVLYLIYTWLFVFSKKEQWHIDSFFGRRIVTLQAAKERTQCSTKIHKVPLMVAVASLAIIIGAPQLHQFLFEYAWGEPSVGKTNIVLAAHSLNGGDTFTEENLLVRPTLRTRDIETEEYIFDPKLIDGKKAVRSVNSGEALHLYDITDPGKVLAGQKPKMIASHTAAEQARLFNEAGLHKQALAVTKRAVAINSADLGSLTEMFKAMRSLDFSIWAIDRVCSRILAIDPNNKDVREYFNYIDEQLGSSEK